MKQCREVIRELREQNGDTQTEIAAVLGISQRTYADYELGRIRIPLESAVRLAGFYNVSMDYIAGITEERGKFPVR